VTIAQKAGENDQLFGSVTSKDIEEAFAGIVEHIDALAARDDHRPQLEMLRQVGLRMHDRCDVARLHRIRGHVGHAGFLRQAGSTP